MYATDESVHLAKILKIGTRSANGNCLNFFQAKWRAGEVVTKTSKYKLKYLNKGPKHGQV